MNSYVQYNPHGVKLVNFSPKKANNLKKSLANIVEQKLHHTGYRKETTYDTAIPSWNSRSSYTSYEDKEENHASLGVSESIHTPQKSYGVLIDPVIYSCNELFDRYDYDIDFFMNADLKAEIMEDIKVEVSKYCVKTKETRSMY
jgi:hypothetical protein